LVFFSFNFFSLCEKSNKAVFKSGNLGEFELWSLATLTTAHSLAVVRFNRSHRVANWEIRDEKTLVMGLGSNGTGRELKPFRCSDLHLKSIPRPSHA
jgi:hypothetical protein